MNREDIIRMAREAGVGWAEGLGGMPEFLERFAALVAAHVRKTERKPWVGLTDEERNAIGRHHAYVDNIIRATEAKLWEKNA